MRRPSWCLCVLHAGRRVLLCGCFQERPEDTLFHESFTALDVVARAKQLTKVLAHEHPLPDRHFLGCSGALCWWHPLSRRRVAAAEAVNIWALKHRWYGHL